MNKQLLLDSIRGVLARLEETIIFALIERAQFLRNAVIYAPGAFGPELEGESLSGFMLLETERIHARMRRYTSPDESPFHEGLPAPILPLLHYTENPLVPNRININARVRAAYEEAIVPRVCGPGDDKQYGSSALCDVACLQALSKRVHYGKFVAESKYRSDPARFAALVRAGDAAGLLAGITDEAVEGRVIRRVRMKAQAYAREIGTDNAAGVKIDPDVVVGIYAEHVIPLNKDVQVRYLLERGEG